MTEDDMEKLKEEIIADAKELSKQMKKFLEFLEKYEEDDPSSWKKEDLG